MQFAPHSLPSRTAFRARPSLPTLSEVGGAPATTPDQRSSGDAFLKDDLSDDELDFPATDSWARALTCPARVTQADDDLMFAFDEDFHEEATERAVEGEADGPPDVGASSESLRSLSGLFFLNE